MEGFDSKTEVLIRATAEGAPKGMEWRLMKDLTPGDEVCTVDERTFGIGFTPLRRVKRGIFTGQMFKVKDQFLNLQVTPGKKLFVGDCNKEWAKSPVTKWSTITAQEADTKSTRHLLSGWIKPPNPQLYSERLGKLIGFLCYRTCFISGGKRLIVPVLTHRERACIEQLSYTLLQIEQGYLSLDLGTDEELEIVKQMVEDRKDIKLPGNLLQYSRADLIFILEGMGIIKQSAGRTNRPVNKRSGYYWIEDSGLHTFPRQIEILCALHGMFTRRVPKKEVLRINNLNIGVLSYYSQDNKISTDWVDYDGMIYSLDFPTGIKLILTRRENRTLITVC